MIFATMKHSELQQPPRKRRKMTEDRSDQSVQPATVAAMASEPTQDAGGPESSHDDQLSKEAEVGITEFVSPNLPGFVGILKKR